MAIDFKEYSRLRDIVVKRNKRAVEAGLMPKIHFPTVKEIKSGFTNPTLALKAVKDYYSSGSQVKTIRQTGLTPPAISFPEMPPEPVLTKVDKAERRKQQQRDYRRRKRVRDFAITPAKGRKYEGFLKALDTVSKTWKKAGFDIGIDLQHLTPVQAQSFVEYMEYRFAQGDFTQRYVIDEFIQDFSRLLSHGHKAGDIVGDFEKFMENRSQLQNRSAMMEGITNGELMGIWSEFSNR